MAALVKMFVVSLGMQLMVSWLGLRCFLLTVTRISRLAKDPAIDVRRRSRLGLRLPLHCLQMTILLPRMMRVLDYACCRRLVIACLIFERLTMGRVLTVAVR